MTDIPLVERLNSYEIISSGIDVEDIARFRKHILQEKQSLLLNDLFTHIELEYFSGDFNYFIPLGFVFKEAMFKAIGESWNTYPIEWKEIAFLPSWRQHQNRLMISGKVEELFYKNRLHAAYVNCFIHDEAAVCEILLLRNPS